MSKANKLFLALALGVLAAAFASDATAQKSAARDAAIHKCINQAHREFPGGEDQDIQRSDAASLGFQP